MNGGSSQYDSRTFLTLIIEFGVPNIEQIVSNVKNLFEKESDYQFVETIKQEEKDQPTNTSNISKILFDLQWKDCNNVTYGIPKSTIQTALQYGKDVIAFVHHTVIEKAQLMYQPVYGVRVIAVVPAIEEDVENPEMEQVNFDGEMISQVKKQTIENGSLWCCVTNSENVEEEIVRLIKRSQDVVQQPVVDKVEPAYVVKPYQDQRAYVKEKIYPILLPLLEELLRKLQAYLEIQKKKESEGKKEDKKEMSDQTVQVDVNDDHKTTDGLEKNVELSNKQDEIENPQETIDDQPEKSVHEQDPSTDAENMSDKTKEKKKPPSIIIPSQDFEDDMADMYVVNSPETPLSLEERKRRAQLAQEEEKKRQYEESLKEILDNPILWLAKNLKEKRIPTDAKSLNFFGNL